jgi:type IV pilus biogenesis protein PilP
MTLDKMQASKSRKRATVGVIFLVGFILVWQIGSMFGKAPGTSTKANMGGGASVAAAQPPAGPPPAVEQPKPKAAEVPVALPMTDCEKALMTSQQATQCKYLEALNELQMLKVTKEITATNKDISADKLATVEAQKKIVDLLTGPATLPVGATTVTSTTQTTEATQGPQATQGFGAPEIAYTVVSISQVQFRWGAVLSYKGILYSVHVGDVLPPDNSMVVAITKDNVTLQKDGTRKKLSLISII